MKTGISDSGLNLTQEKFLNLSLPKLNLEQQQTTVRRIETAFAWLDRVAADAHLLGGGFLTLFAIGVIAYVLYRWRERQRFIEQVKGDRITPDELKHQLESGEHVVIIDLRHPLDVLTDPRTLPGALQISPEELEKRNHEISRDGEVVLFCT